MRKSHKVVKFLDRLKVVTSWQSWSRRSRDVVPGTLL